MRLDREPLKGRLIEFIGSGCYATFADLAAVVGCSRATAHELVNELIAGGLVVKQRGQRGTSFRVLTAREVMEAQAQESAKAKEIKDTFRAAVEGYETRIADLEKELNLAVDGNARLNAILENKRKEIDTLTDSLNDERSARQQAQSEHEVTKNLLMRARGNESQLRRRVAELEKPKGIATAFSFFRRHKA